MGKRNHKKSKKTVTNISEAKKPGGLSPQKKYIINEIGMILLKITNEIPSDKKVNWEVHKEIDKLLQKVQEIEPVFNITTSREDHIHDLTEWIKENGGNTDSVSIDKFEKMEFGLKATRDLKEGDLICSVPRKLMMTLDNIKDSPLKYLYENDPILQTMGNVSLALLLILEYIKGDKSFWHHYISSLPKRYNTVLYFTLDDFIELKGSPTFEPAIKQCRYIARHYAYFYNLFQSSNDEASVVLKDAFTYQLYRWAVSTVMTRQNFVPSQENDKILINCFIPFWDMCNHVNGYLSTQYEADRSECLACKPFKKGEQVLMFYGERSNCDFFVHNGFTYDGNNHDTYRFHLGISKSDKLHDQRCHLLKTLGITNCGDFYLHAGAEPVKEQLLGYLRIFNMDIDHLNHWKSSNRLSDLLWKDCALDTKVESKVWNFLSDRIKLLLLSYNKMIEVTEDDSTLSECRRLVRMQLSLERKFLNTTLDYVRQRIKL